ncbi:MAG: RecB-family nuclease [Candidatus Helarchaeota archaeon]
MKDNLFILFHNINSVSLVIEFTRIFIGFDLKNLIISKAEGSAAMSGVPEAHKAIYKNGKNLLYLSDISNVIDVIKPDAIYLITSKRYTSNEIKYIDIINQLKSNKKIIIGFSGQRPGFSKQEMDLGTVVSLNILADIGPLGSLAIVLNEIYKIL